MNTNGYRRAWTFSSSRLAERSESDELSPDFGAARPACGLDCDPNAAAPLEPAMAPSNTSPRTVGWGDGCREHRDPSLSASRRGHPVEATSLLVAAISQSRPAGSIARWRARRCSHDSGRGCARRRCIVAVLRQSCTALHPVADRAAGRGRSGRTKRGVRTPGPWKPPCF